MPLDIISGKQNTSKYVHSTLVISDKRETAEADKGQRGAHGGSARGHCHPPAARGTAPNGAARLAGPPGRQEQSAGSRAVHVRFTPVKTAIRTNSGKVRKYRKPQIKNIHYS